MKYRVTVCATLLGTALAATAAPPIQPLAAIEAAVKAHVAAGLTGDPDVEVHIGRLDPRLRLPLCEQALDARDTRGRGDGAPTSVEVRCEGAKPWSLYVPVTLDRYADVIVAARPLPRNAALTPADLGLARRRVGAFNTDYFTEIETVTGQITARAIASGQVLGGTNLKRPHLVRRGDQVILTSAGSSIEVRMQGRALEDGGLGDRIDVQNASSERIVEGEVTGAGVVVVRTGAVL